MIFQAGGKSMDTSRGRYADATEKPAPPELLIYANRFHAMPRTTDAATGMLVVRPAASARMSEVLPLASLVSRCPLIPVRKEALSGPAASGTIETVSFTSHSSFFVNQFASHAEYRLLRPEDLIV